MQKEITTSVILETRKPRKDKLFPVKLVVYYKNERHYYTMKDEVGKTIAMIKDDWKKVTGKSPRSPFKELSMYIKKQESHAMEVIKTIVPVFSFAAFEKNYFSIFEDTEDIFSGLKKTIAQLKEEGRYSTAIAYQCTLNSLEKFHPRSVLPYTDVDVTFLNKYEAWMLKNDNSLTTTGIYLRNVRAMFNKNEKLSKEFYPFGKNKYQIPGGRNVKKALTGESAQTGPVIPR
jgi:hypothetical protein